MQTTHITVNSRLSSHIKQQAVLQSHSQVVETPRVMTLSQWWQAWQQAAMLVNKLPEQPLPKKVLSSFEAQWLFELCLKRVLKQREKSAESEHSEEVGLDVDSDSDSGSRSLSEANLSLLNIPATAKLLYQAWTMNCEWLGSDQALALASYRGLAETDLYLEVVDVYRTALEKRHAQDQALYSQTQLRWLQHVGLLSTEHFVLHGFDDLSPNTRLWKKTMESFGCSVALDKEESTRDRFQLQVESLHCYPAQDRFDEAQQVSLWAIQQVNELIKTKPLNEIRVAIVAPDLTEYKTLLTQALDEQLYQKGLSRQLSQNNLADSALYNTSLGEPLNTVPLVNNAMQTLALLLQPEKLIPYQDWSRWLISPYTAGQLTLRQEADSAFRSLQWAQLKWPKLFSGRRVGADNPEGELSENRAVEKLPKKLVDSLLNWLDNNVNQDPDLGEKYIGLAQFVALVLQALQALGWPGDRVLSSAEFQQKAAFENALQQFARLDEMNGKQSRSAWLKLFNQYLSETVHQPQSTGHQPIQIMGMLEAGGQSFDALWVLGLTNESWPRAANPNPFIPTDLQRQLAMPRSDAARELHYAQQTSQRLVHSSANVYWSYPKQIGEAGFLPTSIFPNVGEASVAMWHPLNYQSLSQHLHRQEDGHSRLLWALDAVGNELAEGSTAPGGTGILQAQSQCPLMAYIDYRLGAKYGLQDVEDRLQNTNQGTLVHAVLEWFWQETQNQSALLLLSEDEIRTRLNKYIEHAFTELQSGLAEGIQAVEQNRILELCLQWLQMESGREPFAVSETEQETRINLAGIEFKVIIDRVDQVNGKAVILDYKTGKASIKALLKTPIQAPQLAVYLFAVEQDIAGIGYGLLHSDDGVNISAISEEKDMISSARTIQVFSRMAEKEGGDFYQVSWNDFLDHLKDQVLELAQQVREGRAEMRFAKPADIQYANGYLALRVPEVINQLDTFANDHNQIEEQEASV